MAARFKARFQENDYANVASTRATSNVYEEVDAASGVTQQTAVPNQSELAAERTGVVRKELEEEVTLRTQQMINEPKRVPDKHKSHKQLELQLKRYQLIVGLCILMFVVIALIVPGSFLGYKVVKITDSIGELRAQSLQNVTGQWQSWATWGACSESCGTGLQNRERTCLNPNPNYQGIGCMGDSKEYKICAAKNCLDYVLFSARNLDNLTISTGQPLIFEIVNTNYGTGYDRNTGVFTAPVKGVYMFHVQICVKPDNYFRFGFYVNGNLLSLYSKRDGCSTGITIQRLFKYSGVYIKSLSSGNIFQPSSRWNMFSGVLIRP